MHLPPLTVSRYSRLASLLAGPLALLLTLLTEPPAGMGALAWHTTGLAVWMAIWWITEAVDIAVTALLPLIVAPLLGISSLAGASQPYAHPLIFLFLGGFILSIAMERWNLHRRIALHTMLLVGTKPSQQIGGMMLVTAFLSMWMSNTATAVMMLPIALSVIGMVTAADTAAPIRTGFDKALLLGIAYAASIGGLATLIGTPPNALLAAYLSDTYQMHIGFAQWMALGVPLALLMLAFSWVWLTRVAFQVDRAGGSCSKDIFRQQLARLGPMLAAEKTVLVVFVLTALGWTFRPLLERASGLPLDDTMIAMMAAVALFILPAGAAGQRILCWDDTRKLPWGVLLLFGGGLSLAGLIQQSGLAEYISLQVAQMAHIPLWAMVVLVAAVIIFLTEITSNTATAASFLPLLGPVALTLSGSPLTLTIPAAIAATCAFMLPVATPPNAIVFASGELKVKDMARAGLMLNLVGIVLISALTLTWARKVFGF